MGFGATQQFTATVTGTTNTAVTWSVADANGGTSNDGAISSSGLYTAPNATSASIPAQPRLVSVSPGQTTSSINISVPQLNPVDAVTVTATSQADATKSASATVTLTGLSIIAVGQCTLIGSNCTAGRTGTSISIGQQGGQTVDLFIVGYGIVPGTTYSISGNGTDIVVSQPSSSDFTTASNSTNTYPAVILPIVVSPAAALGQRNLVVTNQSNELAAFPGGLEITQ